MYFVETCMLFILLFAQNGKDDENDEKVLHTNYIGF